MQVDFLEGYRWNPRLFRPRHLLDPEVLKQRASAPKPAQTRAAAAGAGAFNVPLRASAARAGGIHP
jgi:hypothetical protein